MATSAGKSKVADALKCDGRRQWEPCLATAIDLWSLLRTVGRSGSFQILYLTQRSRAERLVVSADIDPVQSIRCPHPAPAVIVVAGVKERPAYERKAIEAMVVEKSVVVEAKPREAWMAKMRASEPGPCEVHSPAHTCETHAPAHAAEMHSAAHRPMHAAPPAAVHAATAAESTAVHAASHAPTVHAASAAAESTTASQRRRRKRDRCTERTSYEAINELADHRTFLRDRCPNRGKKESQLVRPLQMTNEIFSDTQVIFRTAIGLIAEPVQRLLFQTASFIQLTILGQYSSSVRFPINRPR
jgi:hypothetical protein